MRLSLHRMLALLLAGSALSVGGQKAHADELLVMPYSCRVVGGIPVLRPSRDQQGHAVIGRREERAFRSCSPVNPDMCQRWTVHRFDLDCDGQRVPWLEVAAAAEAARGDGVFLSGGQLEIEMPPQWSLPAGAPCGRYREGDAERFGSFERFCEERLARTERLTVAMPRGFAPMFGIDGIFVESQSPRVARAEPPPSRGDDDFSPRARPELSEPAAQPEPQPRRAEPVETAETERQADAAEPIPLPIPKPASKAKAPPEPEKPAPSVADGASHPARPIIPQIINRQNAAAAEQPSDTEETEPVVAAPSPPPSGEAVVPSEVAADTASTPDPAVPTDRVETGSIRSLGGSGRALALNPTVIAVASFAVLSLITLAFLWRRGSTPSAPAISRDIAAVSFDKGVVHGSGSPTLGTLPAVIAPAEGRDPAPSLDAPPRPPEPWGDAMPRTRADALRVLGMGVGPEANEAAIKKIVDGLRVSWHPDHARDGDDRATRELRLKQINAAWDILCGGSAG